MPVKVKPVWIENAQSSPIIFEPHSRKDFFEKHRIAIAMVQMYVGSLSNQLTKACYFVTV